MVPIGLVDLAGFGFYVAVEIITIMVLYGKKLQHTMNPKPPTPSALKTPTTKP